MQITYGKFRGLDSVTLENSHTRVVFLKHYGGRMVSLVNLKTGREYVSCGKGDEHIIAQYGDSFNRSSDNSGVDEIFPSCEICEYPFSPWEGTKLPQHGELWTQDWDFEECDNEIVMSVHGVRFPYTFIKRARLLDNGRVLTSYRIVNHSKFDMYFNWLLHPLFKMEEDVVISMPDGSEKFLSIFSTTPELGKEREFSWPIVEINGKKRDMRRSAEMAPGACEKLYTYGRFTTGRMSFTFEKSGEGLALNYPIDKLPYAGLWINNGRLAGGAYHIALEPAAGGRDWLTKAIDHNEAAILPGKGEYTFYIEYELY